MTLSLFVLAAACAPGSASRPDGEVPRPSQRVVRIAEVRQVGPYLDATLDGARAPLRFFFPRSADCNALLVEGGEALYRVVGPFGRLGDQAGARCEPVGVGSLPAWRDDLPRRRSQYLIPRAQAAYRPLFASDDLLLVRGRFPLTLEIRWPEPMDAVAVMPALPACRAAYAHPTATMEFHASGPEVFWLEVAEGRCPIVGLAVPLEVE
jgi:hypothetical protein